jgi:hypothetical protein
MRSGNWSSLAWVAGAALLLGQACSSSGSASRLELENGDSGRTVVVAVGDEIRVTLQTIGPGQYGSPTVSSGAVGFLGASPAGDPNPGGPRQLYRFEATASGRAEISIAHEGGVPGGPSVAPFDLAVEVH